MRPLSPNSQVRERNVVHRPLVLVSTTFSSYDEYGDGQSKNHSEKSLKLRLVMNQKILFLRHRTKSIVSKAIFIVACYCFMMMRGSHVTTEKEKLHSLIAIFWKNNYKMIPIIDMTTFGYETRPRCLRTTGTLSEAWEMPLLYNNTTTKMDQASPLEHSHGHNVEWSKMQRRRNLVGPETEKKCEVMVDWHKELNPSCNKIHETDITDLVQSTTVVGEHDDAPIQIVGEGNFRTAWKVNNIWDGTEFLFKSSHLGANLNRYEIDLSRLDALIMDKRSSSKFIPDVYGYCAAAGLYQFTQDGSLNRHLSSTSHQRREYTKADKLRIAWQVAAGLADFHGIGQDGRATIANTDIKTDQFLLFDGIYKLNDFNLAKFIMWDKTENKPCDWIEENRHGKFRSPEEYAPAQLSEKTDIYQMGNLFYKLLTNSSVFEEFDKEDAQKMVVSGKRPPLSDDIKNSSDPKDVALMYAMSRCHLHEPSKRPSAREVADYLEKKLDQLNINKF